MPLWKKQFLAVGATGRRSALKQQLSLLIHLCLLCVVCVCQETSWKRPKVLPGCFLLLLCCACALSTSTVREEQQDKKQPQESTKTNSNQFFFCKSTQNSLFCDKRLELEGKLADNELRKSRRNVKRIKIELRRVKNLNQWSWKSE